MHKSDSRNAGNNFQSKNAWRRKSFLLAGLSAFALAASMPAESFAAVTASGDWLGNGNKPIRSTGSWGGFGAEAGQSGIAMVGEGDCSRISSANAEAGSGIFDPTSIWGDGASHTGGIYGFGTETNALAGDAATNKGNGQPNGYAPSYNKEGQRTGYLQSTDYRDQKTKGGVAKTQAYGANAAAFGCDARANGFGAQAMGWGSWAMGSASTAFGINSRAMGAGSFAVGPGARAMGDDSISIGALSEAKTNSAIAVGALTQAGGAGSVAIGAGDGTKESGAQALGARGVALGF